MASKLLVFIYQQSDAINIKVAEGQNKNKQGQANFPWNIFGSFFDRSNYIKAAIKEVYKTFYLLHSYW